MASVSVIIVTYNGAEVIGDCLESLNVQSYKDFEAVVVDNGSSDSTRDVIEAFRKKARYPLKTCYQEKNTGFAAANNAGYAHTTGVHIALLNQDVRADGDWLSEAVKALESRHDVGICASRILTWDGKSIDSAGELMLTTLRSFKRKAQGSGDYPCQELVFAAPATAALYRKSMIEKIGFFDEDFFIQCEDTDLSLRAQIAGWKILYHPASVVYHKVSYSTGIASDISVYYTHRNVEFVRFKSLPLAVLLIYSPMMLFGVAVDFLYFGIRCGKWRLFLKAKFDAVRMLPSFWSKRRRVMGELRKVDTLYVMGLLTPVRKAHGFISMKMMHFVSAPRCSGAERRGSH